VHEKLQAAATALALDLSAIANAATQSEETLEDARVAALAHLCEKQTIAGEGNDLSLGLVAFGSLARHEASPSESDFDHAVVAFGTIDTPEHIQDYRRAAEKVCEATNLKHPGASRIFGGLITGADLINRIGLDDDTNRTHTQRMLFLEESVPIVGFAQHRGTMKSILRRYLVDYRPDHLKKAGVPRFLLNDVVRYWRTVAVDYQAKRWDEVDSFSEVAKGKQSGPKWGMRYIKLRSMRKLAYCGTVISLLMPKLMATDVTEDLLLDQLEMPPLARIAQLLEFLGDEDKDVLGRLLTHADWFVKNFDDAAFRSEVNKVEHPRDPGDNQTFNAARQRSDELQLDLERLFHSDRPLNVDSEPVPGYDKPLCLQQLTARYMLF
jgi:hypothetical protein